MSYRRMKHRDLWEIYRRWRAGQALTRIAAGERRVSVHAGDQFSSFDAMRFSLPPAWRGRTVWARYAPSVRGLKSFSFVMLALLPVALMTYNPCRSAYTSAASSAFRYATAPWVRLPR